MAERRRGRAGGRRHQNLVRFDDQEQALVATAAAAANLTVSRFIAETVLLTLARRDRLSVGDRRHLFGEIARSHRLLRMLGHNIDQLARAAECTGQVPDQATSALRSVIALTERLSAVLDELDGHL